MEGLILPPADLMKAHDGSDYEMVIVTVKNTEISDDELEKYDFLSRCFAPWSGIPEDPVTGNRRMPEKMIFV